jgi:hypothetical protein
MENHGGNDFGALERKILMISDDFAANFRAKK